MLLLIDKVTTGAQSLALFIWNSALVVNAASAGLSPATSGVHDILDVKQFLDYDKSSYISQLIKSKSRNVQNILKYFIRATTSASIFKGIRDS